MIISNKLSAVVSAVSVVAMMTGCLGNTDDSDGNNPDSDGPAVVDNLPGSDSEVEDPDNSALDEPDEPVDEPDEPEEPVLPACAHADLGDAFPFLQAGSTQSSPDRYVDSGCGANSSGSGELIFQWTAPEDGRYLFSTSGSNYDTILYILDDCEGQELACNDDAAADRSSTIDIELRRAQVIFLVVDGYAGDAGDFELSVSGVETACDNGLDDDQDGAADCEDEDCVSVECAGLGEWPSDWASREEQMLSEVNRWRALGAMCDEDEYPPVDPLEMDEIIRVAARAHSKDMGDQNYFEHDGLDGREFSDRMADVGYRGAGPWGENIQAGSSTAAESTQRLINSPGHCRNIMSPEYTVLGVGYAFNPNSEYGHYWTQDFGGSH